MSNSLGSTGAGPTQGVPNDTTVADAKNGELLALLKEKFAAQTQGVELAIGHPTMRIHRKGMLDIFRLLKLDSQLKFNYLLDVTAVDYLDTRDQRFEVVYHLLSTTFLHRVRVYVAVPEEKPEVDSLVSLWSGANFLEREVWDMYGVTFTGHPDLRKILMYDEFVGHPLRKDYPVQGKQPRVPLRAPEVRNTALDMKRGELVKITAREKERGAKAAPGDSGRFVEQKYS